ncbi:PTS beta-glucoside transporter subunit EIIBCA [Enterococcus alcedinis]|uniref:PTS system sucrose-specific EIIBCA component n=1 Tax=Enterococcus alcedinis TaxID=1274384 RepID=A0A917N5U4_9ENTE|nr:PTS system trehalose-specific EIIBC component [Enterococcus alcedinis]MBP2102869.1 PTS system trehalose-specific IIC component [Enterococcus alcedinis]GGI66469.1 PTS beta-glucoside transporter subunit EIIBCA [Enterococcus alcedinis]
MGKYEEDVVKLLEYVGGKENIAAVTHCVTRMRFVLNDPSLADEKKIETLPSVKGMFTNAGQFQVIIGNDVGTFYNEFSAVSGIEGVSKEQGKQIAKKNQNPLQRAIAVLAEIFTPIIPAIIVGGLILGFRNVLGEINFNDATIVSRSVFWNGVNDFLWLPGEAIFHFLPVGITWSITRKMGTTQILGIILGITLVSPQLLNAYAVPGTAAADIPFWDFGLFQLDKIGYQAQVIPAMLAGFLLAYLEIFFRKRIPEAISMIFVPLFALLPTIFVAHAVLGPIGWWLGDIISNVVNSGLTSSFSWLFSFIFGALYSPLVITGLHHMSNAIDMQLISTYGTTNLWPMIALSNIAQGSAVLAIIFLHRGNKREEQISIPSTISAYLGVTEPAMFGINLKYVYPFVAAMIGSGFAGMFSNIMGVRANAIGVGGLPGLLAINGTEGGGWLAFGGAMAIAVVVPVALTILFEKNGLFGKKEEVAVETATIAPQAANTNTNQQTTTETHSERLYSPGEGRIVSLDVVNDPVFSTNIMGEGFALRPTTNQVYSPVNGEIVSIFETKHAIGILTKTGAEVLVHMGLDTVELKGEPFTVHVKVGQIVTPQTLLAEMDIAKVKAAGKETDIVVVMTNNEKMADYILNHKGESTPGLAIGEYKVRGH